MTALDGMTLEMTNDACFDDQIYLINEMNITR